MVFVQPSKFFIEVLHELRAVAASSAPPTLTAPARWRGPQLGRTLGRTVWTGTAAEGAARGGASHAAA
jgi:hypothetical protein